MDIQDLLKKLVSINSVFPAEKEVADYILEYLNKIGFETEKVTTSENRYNLVATNTKSDKYLGFYGHMDTVPADKAWEGNPWEMKVQDDIAYGLGVVDMKGGISAILKAAENAQVKNLPVKLIFGVDEENISQGANDLVDSGVLNDVEFLVVAESGQVRDTTQDFSLCYGRKGRIVFDIEVFGKAAHAAESKKGINAVEKAALLISNLEKIKFPFHNKLGETNCVVQNIFAEAGSFSVPDHCKITCSLLTTPGYTSEEFIKQVEDIAKSNDIEIKIYTSKRPTPYGESYEISLDNSFLKTLESKVFANYKVNPEYMPSVADENVFANRLNIPVLTIGAIGGADHTKDEWVNLKSLKTVSDIFTQIIQIYNAKY